MTTPVPSRSGSPTNSGSGPAASTRAKVARQPVTLHPVGGASSPAAAAANGSGGEEGKDGSPQQQQQVDAAAAAATTVDRDTIADMMKEMKAMREELLRLKQPPQQQSSGLSLDASFPPVNDIAALVRAIQESSAQQAEQARRQQEIIAEQLAKQTTAAASQQLVLRSLGELPTFSGKGGDTTLVAHEWLQRSERYFAIREQALGIDAAAGDQSRRLNAAYALQDDARRWYDALPLQPSTWTGFSDAIKARFCSVPSELIRVDKLREFVDQAFKIRDKLNVQGMQGYTAKFAQLAGEVSSKYLTNHGILELLGRGLPSRMAEIVTKENNKDPPKPLHEVINMVLARATEKAQAANTYGSASATPASAAPINLDAVSIAIKQFGCTREEAQQYLEESEGWAPHDTHGNPPSHSNSSSSSVASSSPTYSSNEVEQLIVNALSRVGAGPAGRDRNAQSRRSVPSGVVKDVPEALAKSRMEAGLCIKCGIAKYEGGGKGHNSRTCKAPVDKTTSAAEGRKKANF